MRDKHIRQRERFRELADAINRAMAGVPSGWQGFEAPLRSAYGRRVDEWHRLMSNLYDGLHADLAAVLLADAAAQDRLTTFLEADVFCHRSGYFKVDAIKALSHVDLSEASIERLERVVLAAVDGPDRREFRRTPALPGSSTPINSESVSPNALCRLIRGQGVTPCGRSRRFQRTTAARATIA